MLLERTKSIIPVCGMTKKARSNMGARQCLDIGLWVADNDMSNCEWRTEACEYCYNRKNSYPSFVAAWTPGGIDTFNWAKVSSATFRGLYRVRLATRGEAFPNISMVRRVGEWVRDNPNTKFWIPTRAFQTGMHGSPENWYKLNWKLIDAIDSYVRVYPNARVMASIDDWTARHTRTMIRLGWSTMFFSKAGNLPLAFNYDSGNVVKCQKTWDRVRNPETGRWMHKKGLCRVCNKGCFSSDRVDVWLHFHW